MNIDGSTQDLNRLISNQQSLLETIPEMVLLIKDSKSVEYLNPSAKTFLGDLQKNKTPEEQATLSALLKLVAQTLQDDSIGSTQEATINQSYLEYTLAPFKGYKGDSLYWLFIRDLTENQNQLEELSLFHNSIETILSHKIHELKESEKVRKNLSNELNSLKEHLKEQPNGTTYTPLNIKKTSQKFKTRQNDRLINYTMTFEMSYNEINNI